MVLMHLPCLLAPVAMRVWQVGTDSTPHATHGIHVVSCSSPGRSVNGDISNVRKDALIRRRQADVGASAAASDSYSPLTVVTIFSSAKGTSEDILRSLLEENVSFFTALSDSGLWCPSFVLSQFFVKCVAPKSNAKHGVVVTTMICPQYVRAHTLHHFCNRTRRQVRRPALQR
jgi:hypothetical protein